MATVPAKPLGVYLPEIPIYNDRPVTHFTRRGPVCTSREEVERILAELSTRMRTVAEVVPVSDARHLPHRLSAGDVRELAGAVPKVEVLRRQHPQNWINLLLSTDTSTRTLHA